MKVYLLYLESGPMRKKTMVHVLDLLGCIANGPTTEEALARTPDAIRAYLSVLQRHGEEVDPAEEFQTEIAEHVTEGSWLGNGDPALVFAPDLEPVSQEERERLIRRMEALRAELLALVDGLSEQEITKKPPTGRSIRAILEHVFGAEYSYIRRLGKLEEVQGPGSVERMTLNGLLEWMSFVRSKEIAQLRTISNEEIAERLSEKKNHVTFRKLLRRTLEHEWEHLAEIRERLAQEM